MRLITTLAFLIGVWSIGCTSLDRMRSEDRVDLVVLTTDSETTAAFSRRLRAIEKTSSSPIQSRGAFRGFVPRLADGRVYTIVVVPMQASSRSAMEAFARAAIEAWRPRYVLAVGTASAVPKTGPVGAIGIVPLICDFDLERFEELGDTGLCYRADGGLLASALSVAREWESSPGEAQTERACGPRRIVKMGALSGQSDPGPHFVEVATRISEGLHGGLAMEVEGAPIARAVEELRHAMPMPLGLLMIRGISEIRGPEGAHGASPVGQPERRLLERACAAHDAVDFTVELMRRRWPVSPAARARDRMW